MPVRFMLGLLIVITSLWLLAGCAEGGGEGSEGQQQEGSSQPPEAERKVVPGGDPEQGKEFIAAYGCGACHTIPGIRQADGNVGPPLTDWADRQYIAGNLPNTPGNLVEWIRFPQAVEPGTVMPNLGVSEDEAGHIAAYLYTLSGDVEAGEVLNRLRISITNLFSTGENTPTVEPEDSGNLQQGGGIFAGSCAACHAADGSGQVGPALTGNEFVTQQDPAPVINTVLTGRGEMPAFQDQLSDEEIAAVISFIRNSWGNAASEVDPQQVQEQRSDGNE